MDNQQGHTVWTQLNVMWQPGCKRSLWGTDTCLCMTKPLCCSRETITTLLIGKTKNLKKSMYR